jgi:hypothetical protein
MGHHHYAHILQVPRQYVLTTDGLCIAVGRTYTLGAEENNNINKTHVFCHKQIRFVSDHLTTCIIFYNKWLRLCKEPNSTNSMHTSTICKKTFNSSTPKIYSYVNFKLYFF